ncbi:MAG TPA: secretin N-terminal domain-containing protein [Gemmatimonadaceae bacterium]|nr:secretin N-terminal domain-containing protein [Gemmatimonadaceae bacterium]
MTSPRRQLGLIWYAVAVFSLAPRSVLSQRADSSVVVRNDSVTIRLVDVDVRAAIQALSRFLDRPVVFGALNGGRVTLETPSPVAPRDVASLLRGVLQSQNLELVADSGIYRVRQKEPPPPAPVAAVPAPRQTSALELFVVKLRHARASEVAATLNALYGRASAPGELGAPPPTLSDQLRQSQIPPVGVPTAPTPSTGAQRSATLAGEVTIVPDPKANSLLIRAMRADFELLNAAIQSIDVRPMQVLIEVLIAEVRRDRNLDLGVDVTVPPQRIGGTNTTIEGSTTGGGIGDLVLRLMNIGSANIDATLRAAEVRGDVSIISRPVVITANNKRAEIVVGSERPFIQVTRALPTDAPIRDQVVQYRSVGTRLFVLPTISEDGYVMLEVTQEVNAATTELAFNAPVISTRSVQTNLLLKDGQTVALGGLADRQKDVNQQGVPLLSRIPLLGGLFGHASRRTTETELFLFITPRVVRSDEEAQGVTDPYLKRAEKVKP